MLDTSIPLKGMVNRPIDVLGAYTKALNLKSAEAEHQENILAQQDKARARQQELTLADLYKSATQSDGSIDRNLLISKVASAGLGKMIPGMQKQFGELDKASADADKTKTETSKTSNEILYSGLKMIDNSLAAMVAQPQINDRMVMAEIGRLVSAGAFDAQAAQTKKSSDEYAKELVSTMPLGNPQALKSWLTQAGMRVMDASKRVELMLPKYDEQDRGGQINQGTIDLMIGRRTDGQSMQKTNTPDALLSAETAKRGQNLQHQAMSAANQIAKEAAQSQIVETPQGFAVINKGAADGRAVRMDNGQPALSANSSAAKNATMARSMTGIIPYARELLAANPTSSGIGAKADSVAKEIGIPLKSSDVAGQLETLAGWMTSNVPRFEGPQGVQDVIIYQQMAGTVGDRTKSVQARTAALDTVQKLMEKYQGMPGTDPATTIPARPAVPVRQFAPVVRGEAGRAIVRSQQKPSIDDFFKK